MHIVIPFKPSILFHHYGQWLHTSCFGKERNSPGLHVIHLIKVC